MMHCRADIDMIKTDGIVIGTRNNNKKAEIKKILKGISLPLLDLEEFDDVPEIIEDGATFEENAAKKAMQLARFCKMSVMADDSGLEIDALDKRPGVYSARYCGEDTSYEVKFLKLFEELKSVPFEKRTARFRCAIALAGPEKLHFIVEASCEGLINTEPLGNNGFGYDPIFYKPEYNQTMAELDSDVKNRISHRALALKLFKERLNTFMKGELH